jgi:hypothetical protein
VIAVCKYIQREYLCSKSLLLYKYIQTVYALKLYYFEKILISLVSFIRLLIRSIELEGEGIQVHAIYRSLCLFRPKTMLVCQRNYSTSNVPNHCFYQAKSIKQEKNVAPDLMCDSSWFSIVRVCSVAHIRLRPAWLSTSNCHTTVSTTATKS